MTLDEAVVQATHKYVREDAFDAEVMFKIMSYVVDTSETKIFQYTYVHINEATCRFTAHIIEDGILQAINDPG